MFYIDGHPLHISPALGWFIIIVFLIGYVLPWFYDFWKLYEKAGKPGWAVIIPFYGPIVAAQIGRKHMAWPILFGLVTLFHYSANNNSAYYAAGAQAVILIGLGLVLLSGMMKQYKASSTFWLLLILQPLVASYMLNPVKYKPKKV